MSKLTVGLMLSFAFALITGASTQAASKDAPKIKVKGVDKNSVVLSVKDKKLKKNKAKIKVFYREDGKKNWAKTSFKKKFGKNGKAKVTVLGFKKDTKYEIKAKDKKTKLDKYSKFSSKKRFRTVK